MSQPLIAYYWVSTRRQGDSGVGLEAQQSCVADYARAGGHTIIGSYQEIETGWRADRPELGRALAHARYLPIPCCF
jgi:DNA invertase Pin-like site-specific DNA recombinase